MTDFSKTLIRCSALGYVLTEPRGKTNLEKYNDAVEERNIEQAKYDAMPNKSLKSAQNKLDKVNKCKALVDELYKVKDDIILSDTCKSYLMQSYVLSKYNRVREVQTKQTIKGTVSEKDAIQLFSSLERYPFCKNTYRLQNDWFSGTPDLYDGDDILNCTEIIDIKSSWDIFTFLQNVSNPHNDMYYYQIQGYMALTGAKIGTIAYCLVDTPDHIVESEKWTLLRNMDCATMEDASFINEAQKLLANRKFSDIPPEERLLTYSFDRDDAIIERMCRKVELCRQFLAEFEQEHLHFSKTYRKRVARDILV